MLQRAGKNTSWALVTMAADYHRHGPADTAGLARDRVLESHAVSPIMAGTKALICNPYSEKAAKTSTVRIGRA